MKKVVLFVFNGDPMCFIHVLLNALDMNERGYEAKIVVEGAATRLLPELAKADNPMHGLWDKAKSAGLVHGTCKACSKKMETVESALSQGLSLLEDMSGHPAMASYRDQGFEVVTF